MFITMSRKFERLIVPTGTELNYGPSEDSDSVITIKPTRLRAVGKLKNGALPVRIMEGGQEPSLAPLFLSPSTYFPTLFNYTKQKSPRSWTFIFLAPPMGRIPKNRLDYLSGIF